MDNVLKKGGYFFLAFVLAVLAVRGVRMLGNGANEMFRPAVGKNIGVKSRFEQIKLTRKNEKGEILNLIARKARIKPGKIEMEDVKAVFTTNGQKPLTIVAKEGEIEDGSENAVFRGDVRVESTKPFVLETERLDWIAESRLLSTDEKIKFHSDKTLIFGKGIRINVDSQNVTILSSVNAYFN